MLIVRQQEHHSSTTKGPSPAALLSGSKTSPPCQPVLGCIPYCPAQEPHVLVRYLEEQDLPYTVFQPLYLYGDYTGKDCEQWYMDRILRCAPKRAPKYIIRCFG